MRLMKCENLGTRLFTGIVILLTIHNVNMPLACKKNLPSFI